MAAPSPARATPKDAEVMVAILKDMGVTDYDPRLVNQMLEFTFRYVTDVLEDAQAYCGHAGRSEIDADDMKLAIQSRLDHSFTTPPPREFLMEIARQKNNNPLPAIKPHNGPRLPPDRYCLSASNYRLRPLQKRAMLTMPSRLSLSSGSKVTPNFTVGTKQPYVGVRGPSTSLTITNQAGGSPINIVKSIPRSTGTPTINMQPSSVTSRPPSLTSSALSQTVIKQQVTSPPPTKNTFTTLGKRKREDDDDDD